MPKEAGFSDTVSDNSKVYRRTKQLTEDEATVSVALFLEEVGGLILPDGNFVHIADGAIENRNRLGARGTRAADN